MPQRSGIWGELKRQRLGIPLISLVVGLILLFTLLTDPVIDFSKPQSPGLWPRAIISGFLFAATVMLLLALHDVWRERRTRTRVASPETHDKPLEHERDGLITKEGAGIIAGEGVADVDHDNRRMVLGIVGIAAYGIAVAYLGFTLATIGIIVYWLLIWDVRSPVRLILTSCLGTGSILIIFVKVGYLPLPKGVGVFHDFTIWLFRALHLF